VEADVDVDDVVVEAPLADVAERSQRAAKAKPQKPAMEWL
jgi:hypothetical protein